MSEQFLNSIVTIIVAIVGVATLAVIVSKNANTAGVLQAGGNAVGGLLSVAISPVTGGGGLGGLNTFSGTGGTYL
jgi:membrane DNA delivery protein